MTQSNAASGVKATAVFLISGTITAKIAGNSCNTLKMHKLCWFADYLMHAWRKAGFKAGAGLAGSTVPAMALSNLNLRHLS
jgi:hypothetical protein